MDDALCSIGRAQQPPLAFFLIGRGGLLPRAWRSCRVLLSNRAGSTRILRGRTLGARVRSEAARAPFLNAGERKTSSLPLCDRSSLSLSLSLTSEPRRSSSLPKKKKKKKTPAVPQDHQHQEEARARREAEPADSAVDPLPHREQDPIQRQAPPLEAHQARVLERERETEREKDGRREREDECFFFARSIFPRPPSFFRFSFSLRTLSLISV